MKFFPLNAKPMRCFNFRSRRIELQPTLKIGVAVRAVHLLVASLSAMSQNGERDQIHMFICEQEQQFSPPFSPLRLRRLLLLCASPETSAA
jgi:hypothetical protein